MHLPQPYPLLWHLVDTAAVAAALWDRFLTANQRRVVAGGLGVDEERARSLVMFWAGLHDVGKATPGFQSMNKTVFEALRVDPDYDTDRGNQSLRHEKAAQLAMPELLRGIGYPEARRASARPSYRVAQMLGGHHGRFKQTTNTDSGFRDLGCGGWVVQRTALFGVLHEALGCPEPPAVVGHKAAVLITGLIILADWLTSQEQFLRQQLVEVPKMASAEVVANHLAALSLRADRLLDEAGLSLPRLRNATFQEIFPYAPNALQRSVIDELLPNLEGPGLLVVTAATGDGKTEAALLAARAMAEVSESSGFFFALPTMATSDQMYRRVRRFAAAIAEGPAAVTLLHSMSWLNAEYEARSTAGLGGSATVASDDTDTYVVAPDWLRGRKRGVLAHLSVGTIDQALLAALPTKHNALRMLGLSGKVFIVDEAHAYDEYMQALLRRLLNWLDVLGCRSSCCRRPCRPIRRRNWRKPTSEVSGDVGWSSCT
jgi:CRISPR-associated endonuclease/helicase Cas3